jgi:hypothetical protein
MEAGEAQGTLRAIQSRLQGASFGPLVILTSFVVGVAATYGAILIVDLFAKGSKFKWPLVLAMVMPVVVLARPACMAASKRLFRRNMKLRSMPTRFGYTLCLSDEQVLMQTEWMQKIAPWSSVTEIVRSKNYWIFLIGFEPWFAPSRFFSNTADEISFIETALGRMRSEAIKRSPEAQQFVARR